MNAEPRTPIVKELYMYFLLLIILPLPPMITRVRFRADNEDGPKCCERLIPNCLKNANCKCRYMLVESLKDLNFRLCIPHEVCIALFTDESKSNTHIIIVNHILNETLTIEDCPILFSLPKSAKSF